MSNHKYKINSDENIEFLSNSKYPVLEKNTTYKFDKKIKSISKLKGLGIPLRYWSGCDCHDKPKISIDRFSCKINKRGLYYIKFDDDEGEYFEVK